MITWFEVVPGDKSLQFAMRFNSRVPDSERVNTAPDLRGILGTDDFRSACFGFQGHARLCQAFAD